MNQQLWLLFFVLCLSTGTATGQRTILVNNSGTDTPESLHSNATCNTLHYCLLAISMEFESPGQEFMINLVSDQAFGTSVKFQFTLHQSITVYSLSLSTIFIKEGVSVIIVSNGKWEWNGIQFQTLTNTHNMHKSSKAIQLSNAVVVSLVNCKIENASGFYFYNITTLVVNFRDAYFIGNTGTALVIHSLNNCLISGNITLSNNQRIHGVLQNNLGIYECGVYIHTATFNKVPQSQAKTAVVFRNNTASSAGQSIFIKSPHYYTIPNFFYFENKYFAASSATQISFSFPENSSKFLSVFPGQSIILDVSVKDVFGKPSSCVADMFLNCKDQQFSIVVPAKVSLGRYDRNSTKINTNAMITSRSPLTGSLSMPPIVVIFKCPNAKANITLKITDCPIGFHFNKNKRMCHCNEGEQKKDLVCSVPKGAACIRSGVWYGNAYGVQVAVPCKYSTCKISIASCPIDQNYGLIRLPTSTSADDLCIENRGGILCMGCRTNFTFTFLAEKCVSLSHCKTSHSYIIVFLSVLMQIVLTVLLLITVRFKLQHGVGVLFGPTFFMAIIYRIPFNIFPEFNNLNTAINTIVSLLLLDTCVLGEISWCFFPSMNKIHNYSLRYLGPLIALAAILLYSFIARKFPHLVLRWQSSPLRAICVLLVLTFWSLANTSLNVLYSEHLHGHSSPIVIVPLQPDLLYFSSEHLLVAVPAIFVIFFVLIPLVLVLALSPFLMRRINLTQIKPFLDEFHSCFHDKFRWYSVVYFCGWTLIIYLQNAHPLVHIQWICGGMLCTHIILQPYKSKTLNVINGLLLLDIVLLTGTLAILMPMGKDNWQTNVIIFVYFLIGVPTAMLLVVPFTVLLLQLGIFQYIKESACKRFQRRQSVDECTERSSPPSVPAQVVNLFDESGEREPLIAIANFQT